MTSSTKPEVYTATQPEEERVTAGTAFTKKFGKVWTSGVRNYALRHAGIQTEWTRPAA